MALARRALVDQTLDDHGMRIDLLEQTQRRHSAALDAQTENDEDGVEKPYARTKARCGRGR